MSDWKLTPRENLLETMKGGKPERFVKHVPKFIV